MKIGIINYGAGNTASVKNAMDKLGVTSIISNDPNDFENVDKIVFPGVGHAREAMINLRKYKLDKLIISTKKPLLGICLGMQLLGTYSEEGETEGLGICDFGVNKFNIASKCPHMGWNTVSANESLLFNKIPNNDWFYFVHNYYIPINERSIALTSYEIDFCVSVRKDNFWGVQFHPEKSGESGLQILKNFIDLC
ncbi:MAG: imidazole glycerol phosphate synthase subunit HisH [Tenuifilaceae bacterium]